MTYIPAVSTENNQTAANYYAVKIKVNDPKTNIRNGFISSSDDNGVYNAVDIEVNRPSVEAGIKPVYSYPQAESIVTSDMAGIYPVNMPAPPVSYHTNLINNRTFIKADFNENHGHKRQEQVNNTPEVPAPNLTSVEEQKNAMAFHGLSFKANAPVKKIEIIPPEDIQPDVNIPQVVSNLSDENYDVQTLQMSEIMDAAIENPQKAVPYIVKEVYASLIDIIQKDTLNLTPPDKNQIEIRKKISINKIVEAVEKNNNKNDIELPYNITEEEMKTALTLTEMEEAERNKEYAIVTTAVLTKIYIDEVEKHLGTVVSMTDLPGVSAIVDALRYNKNPEVRLEAVHALNYIARPEYKDELGSLFAIAAKDENPFVGSTAMSALVKLNENDGVKKEEL